MIEFVTYDVFTGQTFGGNPLAVIPDARGLTEDQLTSITREFNYSETTFVYPPEHPAHDARVRIFTPSMELPFAGHPTIGTALALHALGRAGDDMVLELGVGPIPVSIGNGQARFTTRVPLAQSVGPSAEDVGRMISLGPEAVRIDNHAPTVAGVGVDFVLAELTGPAALATATPAVDAFRAIGGPDAARLALLVYIREDKAIRARMFAPLGGIMEDPATGSAAAALAAFLGYLDGESGSFEISQGIEMGRPSLIGAEVTVGNGTPVEVAISGKAVKVMEGRLSL